MSHRVPDLQIPGFQEETIGVGLQVPDLQEETIGVGLHLLFGGTTTTMLMICLSHLHNQEVRQENVVVFVVVAITRLRLVEFIQSFVRRFAGFVTWHTKVISARTRILV